MLFSIFKVYARLAIKIYCRKIIINRPEMLQAKGPLLLAANHPNSFLDGIIITTLFEQHVYSLARGDAFKKKWHEKLLRYIHLLPVYRISEGVENLEHNYITFELCHEVFKKNGIVLMFSEGRCINEWHLRPLKKGTARLAISAWMKGIDVTVVPVGINYNSFRNFGKNVIINFGRPLNKDAILEHKGDGKLYSSFNEQLQDQLEKLVYEIAPGDIQKQQQLLTVNVSSGKKILLAVPALVGFITHAPLYFLAKALTNFYFDNDHFDSALVSILLLAYPLYLIAFFVLIASTFSILTAVAYTLLMPFCAWACVQLKKQI